MAKTKITNTSDGVISIPGYPTLGPGRSAIVDGTPEDVLTALGGSEAAGNSLRLEATAESTAVTEPPPPAASAPFPSKTLTVNTTAPLAGGGTLEDDLTLTVAMGLVGDLAAETVGATAIAGVLNKLARADHVHALAAGTPVAASGATNSAGAATTAARSDHLHRTLVQGLEEGVAIASRPAVNFIGTNVTVVDNPGADCLDVTVTGGSEPDPDVIDITVYNPASLTEINVFVDGINGDDDNDGLSDVTALKTFRGVYHTFPLSTFSEALIIVNVAGTGGFGANSTTPVLVYDEKALIYGGGRVYEAGYIYVGPEMILSISSGDNTPTLDATTPAEVVNNAGVVDPTGQRTRLNFSPSPGWTVNSRRGQFVQITRAGMPWSWELPISANTAASLTVDILDIEGGILSTDDVRVVTNAVNVFDSVDGIMYIGCPLTPTFESGQRGDGSGNESANTFTRMRLGNFVVANGTGISFDRVRVGGFCYGPPSGDMCFNNCNGVNGYFYIRGNSFWDSYNSQSFNPGTFVTPIGEFAACSLIVTGAGIYHMAGTFRWHSPVSSYAANDAFFQTGPAGAVPCGAISAVGPGTLVIMSELDLSSARPVALNGTGALGGKPGIGVSKGAQMKVNGGEFTSITGAGGDIIVDGDLGFGVVAYGTDPGEFEDAAGFNGNLHRLGGSTATVPLGSGARLTTAPEV